MMLTVKMGLLALQLNGGTIETLQVLLHQDYILLSMIMTSLIQVCSLMWRFIFGEHGCMGYCPRVLSDWTYKVCITSCICFILSVPETDSEPEDDEAVEVWSESEEVINDIKNMNDTESEPEELSIVQNETSKALTRSLLTFLMFMQAVYHLSDTVITYFLHFFWVFLAILGQFCTVCAEIGQQFPSTLYKARKCLVINKLNFRRYVLCKRCHQIYYFSECIEGVDSTRRSKLCSFVQFPHHPHCRMRTPCGALLLKNCWIS